MKKPRYDEGCAVAFSLGIVGDRWALLVVRELMLRPKRFQAIRSGLPGITASVLSTRLDDLIDAGIVDRDDTLGTYQLTEAGRGLRPVLHELGRWGAGRPGHDPRKFLSPTSLMLSLAVMVDRDALAAARTTVTSVGFDLGAEQYVVRPGPMGEPEVTAVRQASGDVILTGAPNVIGALLYGGVPAEALSAAGALQVEGELEALAAFVSSFRRIELPGEPSPE